MTALPPLLLILEGHDYESRGAHVYRISHADGSEVRVCLARNWPRVRARLETAANNRRGRLVTLRPVIKRVRSKRTPATMEIIERLKNMKRHDHARTESALQAHD